MPLNDWRRCSFYVQQQVLRTKGKDIVLCMQLRALYKHSFPGHLRGHSKPQNSFCGNVLSLDEILCLANKTRLKRLLIGERNAYLNAAVRRQADRSTS